MAVAAMHIFNFAHHDEVRALASGGGLPRLSEFYGITICMYYEDHSPPHFHAIYGNFEAIVGIDSQEIVRGRLPARAAQLVAIWSQLHTGELRDN